MLPSPLLSFVSWQPHTPSTRLSSCYQHHCCQPLSFRPQLPSLPIFVLFVAIARALETTGRLSSHRYFKVLCFSGPPSLYTLFCQENNAAIFVLLLLFLLPFCCHVYGKAKKLWQHSNAVNSPVISQFKPTVQTPVGPWAFLYRVACSFHVIVCFVHTLVSSHILKTIK